MKKILSILLCLVMALGLAVPAMAEGYTAGTYTASADGNNGPVTVEGDFDENAITAVRVTEHAETAGICETPIERIPAAIVENQSLAVDTIAGAANTSNTTKTVKSGNTGDMGVMLYAGMALLSLNPVDREVMLRFYFYYQKTADIAADMELNESTVRTKLNRGRAKLRDFLTREGHNEKDEKGGAAWNTTSMI